MSRFLCYALFFILCASLFPLPSPAQGVITTVAGSTWIFRGDGGPAANAPFGEIFAVAVDAAGNVYAADKGNHIVVKISPAGIATVVAGNGLAGFSGEGGPATSASLNQPQGLAIDAAGNLYIAERGNRRVRKVSADGRITTFAGNGNGGASGDGGPATKAAIDSPFHLAFDPAGNLYIAQGFSFRVRKVSPDGTITTLAGNGIQGFSGDGGPATAASLNTAYGVAADAAGNVYIADAGNGVRKVSPNGIITTVTPLGFANGVALDRAGTLYLSNASSFRVYRVNPDGSATAVAGAGAGFSGDGGPATGALMFIPAGLAFDSSGNLYIADSLNGRVRKVDLDGIINTVAGNGQFKFLGDGGPASSAALNAPDGVAVDAAGNLYVGDSANHRIRKVSPDGTITTVAGTGTTEAIAGIRGDGRPATEASVLSGRGLALDAAGNLYIADYDDLRVRKVSADGIITTFAGSGNTVVDGGPATRSRLGRPSAVALDAAGNLYIADTENNRIRKVDPAGTITTVAGNGTAGFSGDGGPATSASLTSPRGVAVDSSGNIYISDGFVTYHRVRKVSPSGIISTFAGTGPAGFLGDGGPATSAMLNQPRGLAVDAAGNLYITEANAHRIRKVSPAGIITTVAGRPIQGFDGDGGAATSAKMSSPQAVAVEKNGNLYISDQGNDRIRKVLTVAPSFSLAPATLEFSAPAGAAAAATQTIAVSSTVAGLAWTAQASTQTGGAWLTVSPAAGTAPGGIVVSVNVTALTPGTYQGLVTVQALLAASPIQTVPVALTVTAAPSPLLLVEPSTLSFEGRAGAGNPAAQTLRISNGGGGTLSWTALPTTSSGGNWLSVSPASGTASAASSATLQVSVSVGSLAVGVYSGAVRVDSSTAGQSRTVVVTLIISPPASTILVSQTGLLFTGVEGGGVVPPQTIGILNIGQGVMSWSVQATTFSGGNWLSVSPSSGSSTANALQIALVEVGANVTGMRAGQYSGQVRVSATGADNSPQFVTVFLNVLSPGSNPGVLVRPTGLIFAVQAGATSPGSQTVRLATASAGRVEYVSGLLTFGGDWLQAEPRNAVISAADPRTLTVQPNLGSLAPGIYSGTLTLLFSDRSPTQVVDVLFLVVAQALAPSHANRVSGAEACVPQKLLAVNRSLGSNFASPVGWPSPIEVQVVDDCGNAVPDSTVVASFSNGDPPLALASLRNGIYTGTWRPVNAANQVTVTIRAQLPPLAPAQVQAQGEVRTNPTAAAVFAGGIVHAANFAPGGALAPGSIVSVFGRNLASSGAASSVPLPTALGGSSLNVGGVDVPLFFSSGGQLNAQLPFELSPNTRPHAMLRSVGGAAVPEAITVAAVRPGIFTINQQGTGQGAILNGQGQLVDSSAPAAAGDVVAVYSTGLGATQPAVKSGEAAPSSEPLARVTAAVTATVGGQPAPVQFAGLSPGFVGLYQVNVQIPAGVPPGSAVPLVLTQSGVPSNTVTLAIR